MNWMSFFAKNENISPEKARKLIDTHPPESFQLLDVRQPKEYDQSHIPGAILIPLGDLPARLKEMDNNKETIVYCRSGVRSRAGCQVLTAAGFNKVLNMTGGINGWQGYQALGSETLGLDYFIAGDFSSSIEMAYAMEKGLQHFYQLLANKAESDTNRELLQYMARLEDGHMAKLRGQYPELHETAINQADVAEGGFTASEFLEIFGDQLTDVESIIQAGMMFEAQAYDMYSRLARKEDDSQLRAFYLQMAVEEQRHLDRLAKELDQRLA